MKCERRDAKPAWWLLNAIGLLLLGLLALVEMFVQAGGLRGVLEIAVVIAIFRLMATWVRHHRVAIELEEWNAYHRPQQLPVVPLAEETHVARRSEPLRTRRDRVRDSGPSISAAIGWGALSARPWARGV